LTGVGYEQKNIRTMFFENLKDDLAWQCMEYRTGINTISLTTSVMQNLRNSKDCIIQKIFDKVKVQNFEEYWTADEYIQKKKDLVQGLKDFDKLYIWHVKNAQPDLNQIHTDCFTHLHKLLKSNFDFLNIRNMIKYEEE
jgi:uncharacterized short protein YbdD (DUF466 family)